MKFYPKTGDYLFSLIQHSCKNASGMPLNLQVIGRPFQEEIVLHAMQELDKVSVYVPIATKMAENDSR